MIPRSEKIAQSGNTDPKYQKNWFNLVSFYHILYFPPEENYEKHVEYFYRNEDDDQLYFDLLDANHTSKYLVMLFSTIVTIIITPIMCNIVVFETNCQNRTLINRIISFGLIVTICYNILTQTFSLIRYSFGPMPEPLCRLEYFTKIFLILHLIALSDFVIIIRYIFVFKSKNPTAIQDEFWLCFLSMWATGMSVLSQLTLLIFPGKEPMMFHLCIGNMSKSLINVPVKINIPLNIFGLFTVICHTFIHVKFLKHKLKTNNQIGGGYVQNIQNMLLDKINQENMFNLLINGLAYTVLTLASFLPNYINEISPNFIDTYPNYLLVYFNQHVVFSCAWLLINIINFYKKPIFFTSFKRNCETLISYVKDIF